MYVAEVLSKVLQYSASCLSIYNRIKPNANSLHKDDNIHNYIAMILGKAIKIPAIYLRCLP